MRLRTIASLVLAAAATVLLASETTRVSVSTEGDQGNQESRSAAISADGRYVAFSSRASTLIDNDLNNASDVFVRDRLLGATIIVSVSSSGARGNGNSQSPAISADGRYVAFTSSATNLVTEDTNGLTDVFVRDLQTGQTTRASLSTGGAQANQDCDHPALSADGRYVAFDSLASNLAPGDVYDQADVFVHDRQTGTTEVVSLATNGQLGNGGSQFPAISADGRFVAFQSTAPLTPGDLFDLDVFVRDRLAGVTEIVSVSSGGEQGNDESDQPSISADGRYVAFRSAASNLVPDDVGGWQDVFVRDRIGGITIRASLSSSGEQGNHNSVAPVVSPDGAAVAFASAASNLVPGDTNGVRDVFVRDLGSGETRRVSVATDGTQGNAASWILGISTSEDADVIAYDSSASNLVPGDTNARDDVFVWDDAERFATISGTIIFGALDPQAPPPSQVEFEVRHEGESLGEFPTPVSPDGEYSLTVPAWPLTLSLKHSHWLRRTVLVDASGGDVFGVDLILPNGDATDDNTVDIRDLSSVLVAFGTSGGMEDLNENGVVDLGDLNVVLLAFGTSGDP